MFDGLPNDLQSGCVSRRLADLEAQPLRRRVTLSLSPLLMGFPLLWAPLSYGLRGLSLVAALSCVNALLLVDCPCARALVWGRFPTW